MLFKEDPDEDKTAVVGTLYVKQWFADNSKILEVTIDNKDLGCWPSLVVSDINYLYEQSRSIT